MLIPRSAVTMFSVGVMVLVSGMAGGQDYPNKPVRIVCSGVGGGSDLVARIMAQGIAGPLRQPVTVENRGGDILQALVVYQAPPDGYTLLVYANPLWIAPFLQKTPYDPVKNFATITLITRAPNILAVHPSLPVKSVKELIALAKARPGELNYASGATGGPSHLLGELFKAMAGVNIVRIPYKSGSLQMVDLLAGQVQLTVDGASTLMPHIKSGRLRALAVTTAQPSSLTPGLPTMSASGLRGYEGASIYGAWAPGGTPAAIINRLNLEMVRFLNQPEAKQRFLDAGLETVGSSPEEFAAFIEADMARWGKLIREVGIKAE